jgi:uncharacterized lipoprotein YmbA
MPSVSVGRVMALALVAVVATGCFKLARTSPPVERYVLGGAPVANASVASSASGGLTLGLRRLDLAPYLSTLAIVVRRADNEIVASGFHRWAESPSAGLNRAVAGYLLAAPSVRSVDVAPWAPRSAYDYVVQLHVTRFEGVESGGQGASHVQTRWEIIRPPDDVLVARGTTDVRASDWAVDDYAGLVARLDRGLVVLSQDIVACLGRLGSVERAGDAAGVAQPLECGGR